MYIDLLASSISYKNLFELQPKLYYAYNLLIENNEICNQEPFKVLINKYKEEKNNMILFKEDDFISTYITENMSLNQINKIEDDYQKRKLNIKNQTYETIDLLFKILDVEHIYFCGLKEFLKNIWCVYYNEYENIILNVIKEKNEEFLKKLFIETNDDIYNEKYSIKKLIEDRLKSRIYNERANIFDEELFCI